MRTRTASVRSPVRSTTPTASALDLAALAERVLAGETGTAPSVEVAGALLDELKARGRVRQTSTWRGNTLIISVGGNP